MSLEQEVAGVHLDGLTDQILHEDLGVVTYGSRQDILRAITELSHMKEAQVEARMNASLSATATSSLGNRSSYATATASQGAEGNSPPMVVDYATGTYGTLGCYGTGKLERRDQSHERSSSRGKERTLF